MWTAKFLGQAGRIILSLSQKNKVSLRPFKMSESKNVHFTSQRNPLTGQMEWKVMTDDLMDYSREIARSAYADMVKDTGRNAAYYKAIREAVQEKKRKGERAIVLDIGTGTGLLSMMAVRAGADEVYACECFSPIYQTALRVVKANGISSIKIIPKRSTELVIGQDIPTHPNILVTETFDTELIGEYCIATYNHAIEKLMAPSFLAVPSVARVFVQFVKSSFVEDSNTLNHEKFLSTKNCPGLPSVQDVQLSMLKPGVDFEPLSEPLLGFTFDFTKHTELNRSSTFDLPEGTNAAFLFWELDMLKGDILSMFPPYLIGDKYQWREHWIQAAYFIPQNLRSKTIKFNHDALSYYFGEQEPSCSCSFHRFLTRCRLHSINSLNYEVFKKLCGKLEKIVFISDDSLVPTVLQETYPNLQISQIGENILSNCPNFNGNIPSNETTEIVAIGEPHFRSSISSIHDLTFFKIVRDLQIPNYFPRKATIKCILVNFKHLHKIRSQVGEAEDFDMSEFDTLITSCQNFGDDLVEFHPLWEYEFEIIDELIVGTVDAKLEKIEIDIDTNFPLVNGCVFFVDWDFDNSIISEFDTASKFKKSAKYQSIIFIDDERKKSTLRIRYSLEKGFIPDFVKEIE